MSKLGILVCGHGSRSAAGVEEFKRLVTRIADRFPDYETGYGLLQFAEPTIQTGLDELAAKGIDHILGLPAMLHSAGHVKVDIASILNDYGTAAARGRTKLTIKFARDPGPNPQMLNAAAQRIEEVEGDAKQDIARDETLLMVVGRGTSDPDANRQFVDIARKLGKVMKFGETQTCYSGVTLPRVTPALEKAVTLGYRRIIVFPYFLFTGVLVQNIYLISDQFAARHRDIDFLKAGYLNDHPQVVDSLVDRVKAIAADGQI